jgi:phosphate transport system substrate-binding protein
MKLNKKIAALVSTLALTSVLAACGAQTQTPGTPAAPALTGTITIDGSSTVYPVSEAVAEEFQLENSGVRVSVSQSGTGGGMKKFVAGEIEITGASRKIKDSEMEEAKAKGIEVIEIEVAYDGIAVVVNNEATFTDNITLEELNSMWKVDSAVTTWKDVNPAWPADAIKFYSPGTASGTFEYFTEAVNKEAKSMRQDPTLSEDDNVLVQGVSGDRNAIGYFGYSYFEESQDKLKALNVDGITPTVETIKDGSYPLARPLFIYVNKAKLEDPAVMAFVEYYLKNAEELVPAVDMVPLTAEDYAKQLDLLK